MLTDIGIYHPLECACILRAGALSNAVSGAGAVAGLGEGPFGPATAAKKAAGNASARLLFHPESRLLHD